MLCIKKCISQSQRNIPIWLGMQKGNKYMARRRMNLYFSFAFYLPNTVQIWNFMAAIFQGAGRFSIYRFWRTNSWGNLHSRIRRQEKFEQKQNAGNSITQLSDFFLIFAVACGVSFFPIISILIGVCSQCCMQNFINIILSVQIKFLSVIYRNTVFIYN